jgi:hypothetical protein
VCAPEGDESGYFTTGDVRAPISAIMRTPYEIPASLAGPSLPTRQVMGRNLKAQADGLRPRLIPGPQITSPRAK